MDNFDRIPAELKSLNQWLCWKYEYRNADEKPTKVPYHPGTGQYAKVTDPATWVSFQHAVTAARAGIGYDGIGFVFTANDPYCGIDFDETDPNFPEDMQRQIAMHDYLNSYSEYSPSGKGIHCIVKASVPHGRKRSNIEVYSSDRYFTFTGNVYHDALISYRQPEIDAIWSQMGTAAQPVYFAGDLSQPFTDEEIWNKAASAQNGDLFVRLWNGDWTGYKPNSSGTASSEADFALIDIIAYYTRNRLQIQRMFQASALGKRDKYKRVALIGYMINKSFDNMLPDVDLSAVTDKVNAALAGQGAQERGQVAAVDYAANTPPTAMTGPTVPIAALPAGVVLPSPASPIAPHSAIAGRGSDFGAEATLEAPGANPYTYDGFRLDTWRNAPPPGLVGEVAHWIYTQAPRPVYEYAVAGALGFMAGLCGRAYNVSNTGLNLYVMALGSTGTGKEAIASGVDKLVDAVSARAPVAKAILGPGRIQSGQALLKNLAEAPMPCYLSIAGEFGIRLKQITNVNASDADRTLLSVLLDLYHKSGRGLSVKQMIYSDKKNNTDDIFSPAFTLLGETVPTTFYEALDESTIASGLLPRFLNIEYEGPRVSTNQNHEYAQIPPHLVTKVEQLFMGIHDRMQKGDVIPVGYDRNAAEHIRFLDTWADERINSSRQEVLKQLWNRFHIKVLKVSALLAVGIDPIQPVIDRSSIDWAVSIVLADIVRLTHKFERGEIGMKQNVAVTQETEIRRIWREYVSTPYYQFKSSYGINQQMHQDRVIRKQYLYNRVKNTTPFRVNGSIREFDAQIRNLITSGCIQQLPKQQVDQLYGGGGECYAIADVHWFTEN